MPETSKKHERFAIDPVAFALALVAAPLLVTLLTCWIMAIPVFALIIGGPLYLILGTPVLLIYLHYRAGSASGTAMLAFLTVLIGSLLWAGADALTSPGASLNGLMAFCLFALIFGPLWGGTFGFLYNRWRSVHSRQPLPNFG